jgi:PBP1b-binding outer membrane lipoprotein LpoB
MKKIKALISVFIAILFLISCSGIPANEEISSYPQAPEGYNLDTGLSFLADQIVESLIETKKTRIPYLENPVVK